MWSNCVVQFVTTAGALLLVPFGVALIMGAPLLLLRGRLRSGIESNIEAEAEDSEISSEFRALLVKIRVFWKWF